MTQRDRLGVRTLPAHELSQGELDRILALCSAAYGEDLSEHFRMFHGAVHALGMCDGHLVSHALWYPRSLQVEDDPPFRAAYVEAVATAPGYQRRGFATRVVNALAGSFVEVGLAVLCPSDEGARLYAPLGWEWWEGPLSIRTDGGLVPTPEERVMILRLPSSPPLDVTRPMSAEWREGELW